MSVTKSPGFDKTGLQAIAEQMFAKAVMFEQEANAAPNAEIEALRRQTALRKFNVAVGMDEHIQKGDLAAAWKLLDDNDTCGNW